MVSSQTQRASHARTHTHTHSYIQVREVRTTTKNQEDIKQLLRNNKAPHTRTSQGPVPPHKYPLPNNQYMVQHQHHHQQAGFQAVIRTFNRLSSILPGTPHSITPEAVLPMAFNVSALSSRAAHPPAWASHTSNLLLPAPMESMPTPKPVK